MESNGVANDTILYHRKHAIVSSLCRHLSLDPTSLPSESITEHDIKTLFSMVLKLSKDGATKNNEEVMKWVAFADSFPVEPEACHEVLKGLNEDLTLKSILLGDGLKPSEVDILVFSTLHYFVSALSNSDRQKVPNVMRWMDYIQNKEGLIQVFERILVERAQFEPQGSKNATKLEANANMKKSVQSSENVDKLEADLKPKSIAPEKQISEDAKTAVEKKKLPEKVVEKDTETSVCLLNIQVGLIRKASKHPSADSLLVEEIDVGDGKPRQVVSGLAKYFSPEELVNRHVVLIVNVKPGKLRDVKSSGLVLCASNEDHTTVEPLLPPKGAKLGERVSFSGYDGKPEDVLNPKKKQLEKITPHLYTDDKGVATFKGIPFMTSAGPCTSSIPNAGIK